LKKIRERNAREKKSGLRPGGRKRRILTSARGSYKPHNAALLLFLPILRKFNLPLLISNIPVCEIIATEKMPN
jgi:hypothetical protein